MGRAAALARNVRRLMDTTVRRDSSLTGCHAHSVRSVVLTWGPFTHTRELNENDRPEFRANLRRVAARPHGLCCRIAARDGADPTRPGHAGRRAAARAG